MILDTSALVAILYGEPEAGRFIQLERAAPGRAELRRLLSYALAKAASEPLLFKGNVALTDIEAAA